MAGRLPAVDGRRVVRALARAGFVIDRVAGSHHLLVFPGDPARTVVVPVHAGRDLKPGTLRAIIRRAGSQRHTERTAVGEARISLRSIRATLATLAALHPVRSSE